MHTYPLRLVLVALFATALGLVGLSLAGPAPQRAVNPVPTSGTWSVDAVHSTVLFRIQHLKTSWAYGRFNDLSGEIRIDEEHPEKSTVSFTIEMNSVDTANDKRDGHLKSPDFFDAVQFPTATFMSKTVKKLDEGKYEVGGQLDFHGVRKSITANFERIGFSDTKMGVRAGYFGTFSVKRSDYGIATLPDALGDEVEITVSLELTQTDAGR
jgi:polyisoprenoid-binding protein YceI